MIFYYKRFRVSLLLQSRCVWVISIDIHSWEGLVCKAMTPQDPFPPAQVCTVLCHFRKCGLEKILPVFELREVLTCFWTLGVPEGQPKFNQWKIRLDRMKFKIQKTKKKSRELIQRWPSAHYTGCCLRFRAAALFSTMGVHPSDAFASSPSLIRTLFISPASLPAFQCPIKHRYAFDFTPPWSNSLRLFLSRQMSPSTQKKGSSCLWLIAQNDYSTERCFIVAAFLFFSFIF